MGQNLFGGGEKVLTENFSVFEQDDFQLIDGARTRVIFAKNNFNGWEHSQIQKFKQFAAHRDTFTLLLSDSDILRFLYASHFNYPSCFQKTQAFLSWSHNIRIQQVSPKAKQILSSGAIYISGKDRKNQPIVIVDLLKINFVANMLEDYYSAINSIMEKIQREHYAEGGREKISLIIDTGGKSIIDFPFQVMADGIKTLKTIYGMQIGSIFLIHSNSFLTLIFQALRRVLWHKIKQKVIIIQMKNMDLLYQYFDPSQIPQKYSNETGQVQNDLQDSCQYYSIESNNSQFYSYEV